MMQLKRYQINTLAVIKDFFEKAQTMAPSEAYWAATEPEDVQLRLGKLRRYVDATGRVPPQVAVKVPTGGGKTIIAVEAIRLMAEAQGVARPFVLWFTPSDVICRQTAEALKKATHPYRQALEAVFGNDVRVYGIDEKFTVTPSDVANNVCIVVTTAQAFRHEKHEKYNVYRNNENLMDHFADGVLEPGMEAQENDPTKPKFSFANLIIRHRPLMIVDEAHKMVSDLSVETVEGLRPSAILELTATPTVNNNLLYCVRASELYDEQMIKLPVELTEFAADWGAAVIAALRKREELERIARKTDGETLRPIVLFQATKVDGEVPVAKLKEFLIGTAGCKPEEVAVVTGEQKELDGVDVTDLACPVKCVITVQALKEGWDCPSAYVLCSVANVHSNTDTVQLLGRVMRQPQARRRTDDALNRSYAFVMSPTFNAAADDLVAGLQQKGFDNDEALAAILTRARTEQSDLPLFEHPDAVTLTSEEAAKVVSALPRCVNVICETDGGARIDVPANVTRAVEQTVVTAFVKAGLAERAQEFRAKVARKKSDQNAAAPCKSESFTLPRLYAVVQGEMVFDADDAFGCSDGSVVDHLPLTLGDDDFRMGDRIGTSTELFLNGSKLVARASEEAHQRFLDGFSDVIDEPSVVNALDAIVASNYVTHAEKRHWIVSVVHDLILARRISPDRLYCFRFQLKRVLEAKLSLAYAEARRVAYQQTFAFEGCGRDKASPSPVGLDFVEGFEFSEDLYKDELPFMRLYAGGSYVFAKHFLGPNKIPAFDGRGPNGEGEEYDCARAIDAHPNVKFWLRNADSRRGSFRLPIAEGWFYPDFIGVLNDDRMFVIEYKGEHLRTNVDTVEKTAVGKLWASQSDRLVYRTVFANDDGRDVRGQLDVAFAE